MISTGPSSIFPSTSVSSQTYDDYGDDYDDDDGADDGDDGYDDNHNDDDNRIYKASR
jgi:regulator of RNase E activity RraB